MSVFLITRLNGSFRFKIEDCVLSPKSRGWDHPETTKRYILPFPCILVNPHDIILAFSLFSDQVARSAKPCLHFSLRREAWPWEGRRTISKSRFQFRFLLHGERKSRVRLSSGGGGVAAIWDYGNRADEAGNTCENPKSWRLCPLHRSSFFSHLDLPSPSFLTDTIILGFLLLLA